MKVKDIIQRVRRELLETAGAFWSDEELLDLINKAETELSHHIDVLEDTCYMSLEKGLNVYKLPANFLGVKAILLKDEKESKWTKLNPSTINLMSRTNLSFLSTDEKSYGLPKHYFVWGDEIFFSPTPDKEYTVYLFYKAIPFRKTSVEDELSFPDIFSEAIEEYVLWKAWKKEKELDLAKNSKTEFYESITKYKKFLKKRIETYRRQFYLDEPSQTFPNIFDIFK